MFNLLKNPQTACMVAALFYIPASDGGSFQFFHILSTLVTVSLLHSHPSLGEIASHGGSELRLYWLKILSVFSYVPWSFVYLYKRLLFENVPCSFRKRHYKLHVNAPIFLAQPGPFERLPLVPGTDSSTCWCLAMSLDFCT